MEKRAGGFSGHNVSISPNAEPFFERCSTQALLDIQEFIESAQALMSVHEILYVMEWIDMREEHSAIIFIVVDRSLTGEDTFRFHLSFHAPEFCFFSRRSEFRQCKVKDQKWQLFARAYIGFSHSLEP